MQLIHNGNVIMTNEGGSIAKPITAWAVEVNGKIGGWDIYGDRSTARDVRNIEAEYNPAAKCHVRKVEITVVKGR